MKRKSHGQYFAAKDVDGNIMHYTISLTHRSAFARYIDLIKLKIPFGRYREYEEHAPIVTITIQEHIE